MVEQLQTEYVHILRCHVNVDWETDLDAEGYSVIVPTYSCQQPAVDSTMMKYVATVRGLSG